MLISSKGVPPTGTNAFGMVSVKGFKRVPRPAANIIVCFIFFISGCKGTK
jgi:hypothetical protein